MKTQQWDEDIEASIEAIDAHWNARRREVYKEVEEEIKGRNKK